VGDWIYLAEIGPTLPATPGKPVRTLQISRSVQTDKDGKYRFRIGPGSYQLRLPHHSLQLTVTNQTEIVEDRNIPRPERGPLTGRVTLGATGRTVPGAIVNGESIDGRGHAGFNTVTGGDGGFTAERWLDRMALYARTPDGGLAGYAIIGANETDAEIQVAAAATLIGRVLDSNGQPVAGRRVIARFRPPVDCIPVNVHVITDEQGQYRVTGLAVGAGYTITVRNGPDHRDSVRLHNRFEDFIVSGPGEVHVSDIVLPPPKPDPSGRSTP
ncbi:MAG: hypothetical protein ACREIV_13170, partial [Planctomycetaceae bacterium]